MRCHEVLGIDERATVSDIMLAYENKKTSLTDEHTSVSAEQIQAKLCELNSAKDNCIAWTNMDFASKTANRVKEYSADCFSQNRLNGICWCCPCCTPETSVLCDIAICAGVAFCIVGSIREKNEKHREEDAAKKATVLRDQATKRLSELRNDLGTTKKNIEEAGREYSDAEMTLNAYRMFTSFSIVLVALMMVCQRQRRNYWMIWYRSGKSTRPCVQSKKRLKRELMSKSAFFSRIGEPKSLGAGI